MAYADEVLADLPAGYWRLGEPSGATAVDETANGNDGAYQNTPTLGVTGALTGDADTAVTFNGSDEFVTVTDDAALDLGNTFTLEAWIKRAANGTFQAIIQKGSGAYILYFDSDNKVYVARDNVQNLARSTGTITDTSWHHIVATKTGSTTKMYVDGADVTDAIADSTLVDTADALHIGAAAAVGRFNGSLDEVAVYPTALSAARVTAHYDAALAVGPSNTEQPQLTGTAVVGETLHARDGSWTGTGSITITRQWQSSATGSAPWVDITGETGTSYVLASADEGDWVRFYETAEDDDGPVSVASNPTYEAVQPTGTDIVSVDEIGFAVGGNFSGRAEATQEAELEDMADLMDGGFIRFELNWSQIETPSKGTFVWTTYDRLVLDVEERGFQLLLALLWAPGWAQSGTAIYPDNNSDLADFATAAVERYKPGGSVGSNVRVWEVWNEPNIKPFWDATVGMNGATSRAKYAGMLEAAYDAIKAEDTDATVLMAGLAPFGTYGDANADGINQRTYFEGLIETNGVGDKMDGVAWHTYVSTDVQDYDVSIYSGWSDLEDNTPSVRSILEDNSLEDLPIWVTEHGIPIGQTGTKYPAGVTEQAQADFLTEGYARWGRFSWPKGALIYFSHRPETSATGAYQYGVVDP